MNNIVKDPVNPKYRKIRISKFIKTFDVYKVNCHLSIFKKSLLKNVLLITTKQLQSSYVLLFMYMYVRDDHRYPKLDM